MSTNAAELIEMELDLRSAPEPGGLEKTSIDMGDEVTVSKTTVESAGHVIMYNTDTLEPSVFNMNSIRSKIQEVFPEDHPRMARQRAWTTHKPAGEPWHGTATCPLHKDRPERAAYDLIGYPECDRIKLPNNMEAQRHLETKHPQTWRPMQASRQETERVAAIEDRDINRRILAKLAGVDLDAVMEEAATEAAEPERVVPSVWDNPPTTGQTLNDFHEETHVAPHVHRYGKAMGAKCKVVEGCTAVRTTEFKARKK